MKTLQFYCDTCGHSIKITSKTPANLIRSKCISCGKTTNFSQKRTEIETAPTVSVSKEQQSKPNDNGYVLAADLTINCNHVHVDGIPVKGNVSVNKTTGVKLNKMNISKNERNDMGGKLTITNSEQFSVTQNVIADARIDSSKSFSIDGNLIGYDFEDRETLVAAINSLISESESQSQEQVIKELKTIQRIISKNKDNADIISGKIAFANKSKLKLIGSALLATLKKVGLGTLKKLEDQNVDMAIIWLKELIKEHFDIK